MGLVDDLNWKKEWAQANLEAELWDHLVSLPPESRKDSITTERLAPQIIVMHDHLPMDIKRVLYRIYGKPLFEYRFYAIATAVLDGPKYFIVGNADELKAMG
jgi:hypothetical protein